jgi:hypothetical protein
MTGGAGQAARGRHSPAVPDAGRSSSRLTGSITSAYHADLGLRPCPPKPDWLCRLMSGRLDRSHTRAIAARSPIALMPDRALAPDIYAKLLHACRDSSGVERLTVDQEARVQFPFPVPGLFAPVELRVFRTPERLQP